MERKLEEALGVLGIPPDSDAERVTDAYRRLARVTHPDVSAAPDAAERFATATAAYRLVSASLAPRPAQHHGVPQTERTPIASGSPYLLGPFGARPPIVAGPVLVRRTRREAGKGT